MLYALTINAGLVAANPQIDYNVSTLSLRARRGIPATYTMPGAFHLRSQTMDAEPILKLTPADIALMSDRELEVTDDTICTLMRIGRPPFSAGQIVLFDQIKQQCRLIANIRKIEKAAERLPRLRKQAAETAFTNPDRLAGLDELCAKHDLHVSDGGGWCCQTYKGVTFAVEANNTFGLAGYTLAKYRPAFVQELEAINAAYEQSLKEQGTDAA